MSRRLKTDIPGPDLRLDLQELGDRDWARHFADDLPEALPLVVELGFGRGEFLTHLAEQAPLRAHVGVERSRKRVLKMARRIARTELRNLRLVCASAEEFVEECLAPASVERVWINFSDPWPKTRHHRRRLIQAPLVDRLSEVLQAGGRLDVATDDVAYALHIDEVLRGASRLDNAFAPDRWRAEVPGRHPTAYELQWRAEGRPLHFWSYRRR